jgi:hypothetical protein
MRYQSGEEVRKGDKVLFSGGPGQIEFVVEKFVGDAVLDWHMKEQGPGVMVLAQKSLGRVYIHHTEDAEDLQFVSRG